MLQALPLTATDRAVYALRQWITTVAQRCTSQRTRWHLLALSDAITAYRTHSHRSTIAPLLWETVGMLARVLDAHLRSEGGA